MKAAPRKQAKRTTKPPRSELQEFVDANRRRLKVPGVAVGILHKDRDIVVTSGVTSVDHPLPVDANTLFNIGSTGKTFTATALMRLVEQGSLSLDDPVRKYLPDFKLADPDVARTVTLKHLVTHTGGWDGDVSIGVDQGWGNDALARAVALLEESEQQAPLGAIWAYNNSGFQTAGRIIEVVTGKAFEEAIRELILQPLGMKDSYYFPWEAVTRRYAVGHLSTPKGPKVGHIWGVHRAVTPAGGLVSTVTDQLKWARFHLGDGTGSDGKRVLSRETLDLMQREHNPAGSFIDAVGVSWLIRYAGDTPVVGHGGNSSGVLLSSFAMVPSRDFAVTVLTNSGTGGDLHDRVERWALDRYVGLTIPKPAGRKAPDDVLAPYEGRYGAKLVDHKVVAREGRLWETPKYNVEAIEALEMSEDDRALIREQLAEPVETTEYKLFSPDQAVASDGSRIEFLRAKDGGPVGWLRLSGRIYARRES